ncbi:tyrosine-type recombinase/integrase [Providencia alcalifaciens]|uniref:tyrosine-type recombinase/integrase n=1 Tax=Providencia alcalifaciens TaxID=126385 RepID=UPI000445409C|nr:site-specific integrase [Providencia alcalifaciens]EUD08511.1 putative prophage DLP12 integrase [Providencia alcalifaciens R90-1475]
MPIYKRGKKYWVDIATPSGERVRKSTGTEEKVKAQEYHDKLKHELWQVDKLNKVPDRSFEEMMNLILQDSDGQATYETKLAYAEYFQSIFKGRKISTITSDEISNSLPVYSQMTKGKVSNATRNRYRSFIIRAFSLAHKMGWLMTSLYIPKMKEPKARVRWLLPDEAGELLSKISIQWMNDLVTIALMTGMRKSEILTLTWKNVDLVNRTAYITADNAKSGVARSIPLNDDAVSVLSRMYDERISNWVFSNKNGTRRTNYYREHYDKAKKDAGIVNFTFHDLRHTWASWHAQSGTPLMVLKEMGGWETLEMVQKYAHFSGQHLTKYSSNVTISTQSNSEARKKPHLTLLTG